eukprot:3507404-Rhodomonas_salina.2
MTHTSESFARKVPHPPPLNAFLTGSRRNGKKTHSQKSVTMNHTGPLMYPVPAPPQTCVEDRAMRALQGGVYLERSGTMP